MKEEIILAGGCFWGIQSAFDKIPGVIQTEVGYIGGVTQNPTYEEVCTDSTGHAEAVRILYDSDKISLAELLDIFFMIHDPTTPDRQGPDTGRQYRSAVFYTKAKDKKIITQKIKEYGAYFEQPIITEVKQGGIFYPAETYHQKYFEKLGKKTCPHVEKSKDAFLRKKLTPEQYRIMREQGTEAPFSGKYIYVDDAGTYRCAGCGQKLFDSTRKFQTTCGWPGFDQALPNAIILKKDFSHFMVRDEVLCSRCQSHLGHLFNDGSTTTGLRYCINSAVLDFEKK